MSHVRRHARVLLVAVCCLAVGAAASVIAGAGAATTPSPAKKAAKRRGGLRRIAMRTVHGDFVVHTKDGFRTVTVDRGTVDSVSGQQLRITEGTPKAAYKTLTLTIPSSARVRDDKRPASLSSVKPGQRVVVVQAPKREVVIAHSPRTP